MNAETVPCQICGQLILMTGTKLCNGWWEITSHIRHGYVVMHMKSGGFCYFRTLEPAIVFYEAGIARQEPYTLFAILRTEGIVYAKHLNEPNG